MSELGSECYGWAKSEKKKRCGVNLLSDTGSRCLPAKLRLPQHEGSTSHKSWSLLREKEKCFGGLALASSVWWCIGGPTPTAPPPDPTNSVWLVCYRSVCRNFDEGPGVSSGRDWYAWDVIKFWRAEVRKGRESGSHSWGLLDIIGFWIM